MAFKQQWLAMFPGQGSQYVGMAKPLIDNFPDTKTIFELASDTLGTDILKLCDEGPETDLALTANTQPCILTVSCAAWSVIQKEIPNLKPNYFAGHSLGEYSALVCAEKLKFTDALKLVRARGEYMQIAVPAGVGAMAAVLNCPAEELQNICKEISNSGNTVEVVNFNSPTQMVIAGHKNAVREAGTVLSEKKFKVIPLNVSAPFHSSLMKPARESMRPLLEAAEFAKNDNVIIPNTKAIAVKNYDAELLISQIDNAVQWTQTLQFAHENGCKSYIEIGPGKVLCGLVKRTLPKEMVCENTDQIAEFIQKIAFA